MSGFFKENRWIFNKCCTLLLPNVKKKIIITFVELFLYKLHFRVDRKQFADIIFLLYSDAVGG
jgi:hypothetical protein